MKPQATSSNDHSILSTALMGGLVVIGGALATAIWQGVAEYSRHEAARRTELRQFHGGLLDRVESLAEKSGMLTSADLCPIRLRLRMANPTAFPSESYADAVRARLSGTEPDALPIDRSSRNGTIEFGLMRPGGYRLQLSVHDSYSLLHEFEVLPGVPVDRLVRCPDRTPADFSMGTELEWPESIAVDDVIAVCDIKRDAVMLGELRWQPTEDGCVRVVAGKALDSISDEQFPWITEDAMRDGGAVLSGVPYRYCRVRAISIYTVASGAGSAPLRIALCVFGDELQADGSQSEIRSSAERSWPTVVCHDSAPCYTWPGGTQDVTWRITVPDELVTVLEHPNDDGASTD